MIQPCPTCRQQTPRLIDTVSREAFVNYYRCETCGTVWNKPKDADGPIRIVAKPSIPPYSTDTFHVQD